MGILRSFAVAAMFLIIGLPSSAQTVVTCSSNNGRRAFCASDTRGGVTLGRQISGSPCRRNYSWGYDARGIWVDRGCRADFVIRRAGFRPGPGIPGPGAVRIITCSSENGRRVYCGADTRRGVSLVRQRSGSACRQNYSWGYDAKGIWVDRGCRADFQLGRAMVPNPR